VKIVILGDTHFGGGYSLGKIDTQKQLNTRLIDFSNTFDYVVDYMISAGVRHFILTGDIFEYRRPSASELSLFSEKIHRLSETGIHTHIVIGNHDLIQAQRATTIDVLRKLKLPKVHIYTDIGSVICSDGSPDVINVIFFPFRTRRMLDCKTNDEAVSKLKDRLQYEVSSIAQGPKILVGHFMFQGTVLGNNVLEGHGGEVVLPPSMFKKLDGAIMGHIHPHQIIKKSPLITYIGSMEKKNFGDAKHEKYFLVINTEKDDISFCFEKLPVRPIHDITIDQSSLKSGVKVTKNCIKYLKEFSKKNEMVGSIIRIHIFINEKSLYDLDKNMIETFTQDELKVHNCINIHTQVITKRQLRKSSITERKDPLGSFLDYLDLVEDPNMREKMKAIGSKIIKERKR